MEQRAAGRRQRGFPREQRVLTLTLQGPASGMARQPRHQRASQERAPAAGRRPAAGRAPRRGAGHAQSAAWRRHRSGPRCRPPAPRRAGRCRPRPRPPPRPMTGLRARAADQARRPQPVRGMAPDRGAASPRAGLPGRPLAGQNAARLAEQAQHAWVYSSGAAWLHHRQGGARRAWAGPGRGLGSAPGLSRRCVCGSASADSRGGGPGAALTAEAAAEPGRSSGGAGAPGSQAAPGSAFSGPGGAQAGGGAATAGAVALYDSSGGGTASGPPPMLRRLRDGCAPACTHAPGWLRRVPVQTGCAAGALRCERAGAVAGLRLAWRSLRCGPQ